MQSGAALLVALLGVAGCEVDSFFDQSTVGRWERTPVSVPILDRLDIIDEEDVGPAQVTEVRADDLIPDVREYVIGPGDLITVSVFELIVPNQESVNTRRVDETGVIRLPVVGAVEAGGRSPSQLEREITRVLEENGILRDATVSVILQEGRQNTFSLLGDPQTTGGIGTYVIPSPTFRLLDAVALARGIPATTKTLLVYRQTELTSAAAGETGERVGGEAVQPPQPTEPAQADQPEPPEDPARLIEDLLEGLDEPMDVPVETPDEGAARDDAGATRAPTDPRNDGAGPGATTAGLDLEAAQDPGQWVYVDGQWKRAPAVEPPPARSETRTVTVPDTPRSAQAPGPGTGLDLEPGEPAFEDADDELSQLITQRIIEVPYQDLLNGDLKYNLVIRPGDVIRVPDVNAGFVYVMGQIARPGAYNIPGRNTLTLKQLFASAGGVTQLAVPERVDITRRIGDDREASVRLNVKAIFEGTEPDLFLKPNDLINVGTNFWATPVAVIRNGFRASYGFGFILDRNFDDDVFGEQDDNN